MAIILQRYQIFISFQVCKEIEVVASDNSSLAFSGDPSRPHDMASEKTDEEILDEGGCDWRGKVYGNGATWKPRVLPYGEMKCVECKCKVGGSMQKDILWLERNA